MDEKPREIDDLCLDFGEIAPKIDKTATKAEKSRQKSAKTADADAQRSAMSLTAWLSAARWFPADAPPSDLQLCCTSGDIDFQDAIRAGLISAPADRLIIVSGFASVKSPSSLIASHAAGAFRSIRIILGHPSISPASTSIKATALAAALREAAVPFELRVVRHHAKFAVALGPRPWAIITSANLNFNPRSECYLLSSDPSLIKILADLADANLHDSPAFARSYSPLP